MDDFEKNGKKPEATEEIVPEAEVSGEEKGEAEVVGEAVCEAADATAPRPEPEAPQPEAEAAQEEPAAQTSELDRPAPLEPTRERPVVFAPEETTVQERARKPRAQSPRLAEARVFVVAHRVPFAIGCALAAIAVALLALAGAHAASVPADDVIVADARSRVAAPVYDGGLWGDTDKLRLVNVKVKSAHRTKSAANPASAQFGASAYATATVVATYENDSVRATKEASLGFAKVSGSWTAIGQESDASLSFEPLAGVDEEQVKANIRNFLDRAEQELHPTGEADSGTGELSLAGIYADGKVEVVSSEFDADAKTDVVELSCEKDGAFDKRACQIEATFSFRSVNGLWEITQMSVPADAKARDFSPLFGTWEGTFQSQETEGGKCLAAVDAPLSLTISSQEGAGSIDGSGAQLVGAIDVLAHLHDQPSRDAKSSKGDEGLQKVALTAAYAEDSAEDGLVFRGTLPDQPGGTVEVELKFGVGGDPATVVAKVTTSYERTTSFFFIPYSDTVTYTDTYLLRRP